MMVEQMTVKDRELYKACCRAVYRGKDPTDKQLEARKKWHRIYARKNYDPVRSKTRKDRYRATINGKFKTLAYSKKYKKENREKVLRSSRNAQCKRDYGITLNEIEAMIEAQRGLCAICGKPPSGRGHCSILHVDHCHETGKVRGMVCINCNQMLGCANDNPETLQAAIRYLEGHS